MSILILLGDVEGIKCAYDNIAARSLSYRQGK